jgi:ADP-ribose pyrophosphatase
MTPDRRIEVLEREVVFDGFFKLVRYRLRHGLFKGGLSPILERELFDRGHAAVVLPYDPEREAVVLVEQFRLGALEPGGDPWLLEPVAGIIEPGETPAEVALREAREEAGLELLELVPVGSYFPSPGASSEICVAYVARVDARGAGGLFGLVDHGEDVRAHVVPLATALAWLEDGGLRVASTLITLQWLALHRAELRARWGLGGELPSRLESAGRAV